MSAVAPPLDDRARQARELRAGLRTGLGLAVSTFVLAVTFGAVARHAGWGVVAPIVASLAIFSGSAQFALVTVLAGGAGAVAAITSAGLMNARFLPMALAAAPSLRGGRLRRAVEGQAVVDASFAAAHVGGGRFDRDRLVGATLPQWPAWVAGTAVGVAFAPGEGLVESLGLDVIFPAFFLLLLLEEIRAGRRVLLVAAVAATAAVGLLLVVPVGIALVLASSAALVGLVRPERAP